ncbi:MAG: helix-turn-helix transcriptional regulator [Bacteroidia bacterium]
MNRLERITSILLMLQTKRLLKASDISERFGISLRTVYRDISVLEEAGVPIISEPGLGYSIMKGYSLPPVSFTQNEANTLLMAGKLLEPYSDDSVRKHFTSALDKVKAILKLTEKDHLEVLDERIRVIEQFTSPPNVTQNLVKIQQSIADSHVIEIEYVTNYGQSQSTRKVEPIGLTFYSNSWHLIAWCQLRNDYRDFRTDRISRIDFAKDYYKKSERKGVDEYLIELQRLNAVHRVVVDIKNKLHPYLINQKVTLGLVKETEYDAFVRMEFMTGSLHYFAQTLLTWGAHASIVEPNDLKEMVRFMLHELNSHYAINSK